MFLNSIRKITFQNVPQKQASFINYLKLIILVRLTNIINLSVSFSRKNITSKGGRSQWAVVIRPIGSSNEILTLLGYDYIRTLYTQNYFYVF